VRGLLALGERIDQAKLRRDVQELRRYEPVGQVHQLLRIGHCFPLV
jgi:hypothetical protein